jgi:multidrug efflux pump
MRIWLDPLRMAALNIAPSDVREALEHNNFQAAVGKTKGEAIAINLNAATDLHTAEEFRRLVIAEQDDAIIRLGDVASVILGAEDYDRSAVYTGQYSTALAIDVLPDANILEVIREVKTLFPEIKRQLPRSTKS